MSKDDPQQRIKAALINATRTKKNAAKSGIAANHDVAGNHRQKSAHYHNRRNGVEDRLNHAIDTLNALRRAVPRLEEYLDGKITAETAFSKIAPAALTELVRIMANGESEKNKLDASKHLLGLAGFSPSNKHEISRVDANTPKEALISLLMGNKKALEDSGIEIVEDAEDKD